MECKNYYDMLHINSILAVIYLTKLQNIINGCIKLNNLRHINQIAPSVFSSANRTLVLEP